MDPAPHAPHPWFARFELRARLGAGALGVVHRAFDPASGREVALKVLALPLAALEPARRAEVAARFAREARVARALDHPGIARVHDAGEHDGVPWIAMELVRGETLGAWLARRRGAPGFLPAAIALVREAALAVAAAHAQGTIHRDLKPDNILVEEPSGRARVTDFGLATEVAPGSRLTWSGDVVGTPQYMAPEQARGDLAAIGARTDVYGLGATLYQVLAGRAPYDEGAAWKTVVSVVRGDLVRPRAAVEAALRETGAASAAAASSAAAAAVPDALEAICLRAMACDPGDRYPSALALADDLAAWLAGEPRRYGAAPAPSGPTFGSLAAAIWSRYRARIAAAAAALVVLALAAALFVGRLAAERRTATERLARILELSDLERLEQLERDAALLWPASSAQVPAMEAWLARWREVADRAPAHRAALAAWRARPEAREQPDESGSARVVFPRAEEQWEHDSVAALVAALDRLALRTVPDVEARLAFARSVRARTLDDPASAAAWAEAQALLAGPLVGSPYAGRDLALEPIEGLIPLGLDPESGLLELWHVQTGERPARDPSGRLAPTRTTGLVLVLLPGGRVRLGAALPGPEGPAGAPFVDPGLTPDDLGPGGRLRTEEVAPFLIAKHEMTQGQWHRAFADRPSFLGAGTFGSMTRPVDDRHPVEGIDRPTARRHLARLGLALPTEAQWEYAARAGTDTVYWTGSSPETLVGAANLADRSARPVRALPGLAHLPIDEAFDDGFPIHAPVGSLPANPFGLHDVAGNVWEWCSNRWDGRDDPAERLGGSGVIRGGAWSTCADALRSAARRTLGSGVRNAEIGVRPVRALRP